MREKIANSIAEHWQIINELKALRKRLEEVIPGSVQFIVKSKSFAYYFDIATHKDKMNLSTETMKLVVDKAIEKEKERIDKLIDMEIDRKIGGYNGNK